MNNNVYDVLKDLGISPMLKGFHYLELAIAKEMQCDTYKHNMTTMLYPEIAEEVDSTPSRVERGIRHAVTTCFDNSEPDVISKYFGNLVSMKSGKVTNGTFIAVLADYVKRIEQEGE